MTTPHIVIIGGGAAGIFAAITAKEANPLAKVTVIEKGALLTKVRISGGGRCNVTHHCFDPKRLVTHYPRGEKALLGPFTRFQPQDTVAWFKRLGVELKSESDGRMFPVTDSSATIIDALLMQCAHLGVVLLTKNKVVSAVKGEKGFTITCQEGAPFFADTLLLATGSNPEGHALARALGHTIVEPVPSLFTFNVPSSPLLDLSGISVEHATIGIEGTPWQQSGPLLLTHWGFSGPAALKLSAWAARPLNACGYRTTLYLSWVSLPFQELEKTFLNKKKASPQTALSSLNTFGLAKNLWKALLGARSLKGEERLSHLSDKTLSLLAKKLTHDCYQVEGKTTYKQEFVTAGGVQLDEVNFKTMESRLLSGLYFAGEVLDIDGITGGFNFQNAWTTGWLAGNAMATPP